jgi:hypothetical protein
VRVAPELAAARPGGGKPELAAPAPSRGFPDTFLVGLFSSLGDFEAVLRVRLRPLALAAAAAFLAAAVGFFLRPAILPVLLANLAAVMVVMRATYRCPN